MTDRKLDDLFDRLKRAAPPSENPGARRRAVDLSVAAFDDAAKGTAEPRRQTSAGPSWVWRTIMQNRMALGGAAACLVAIPLAGTMLVDRGAWRPKLDHVAVDALRTPEPQATPRWAPPPQQQKPEERADAAVSAKPAPPSAAPEPQSAAAGARMATEAQSRSANSMVATSRMVVAPPPQTRDRFAEHASNGVKITAQEPVSTFSIDVDTASYSWVRRALQSGRLPSPDEVRVEELINYFPYDYARPASADAPFRPTVAVYPTPWNRDTRLVHIGIKGFDAQPAERRAANLVFLIDVSGSMAAFDKLPLLKASLKLLLGRLDARDHVAIVTYAGGAGVALEPTPASDRDKITDAIDRLSAGGSTAGAAGIQEAYRLARRNFDKTGVNRVLLATDGDFNVGATDDGALTRLIETERKSGVFLSVLGFGEGNYNDALMQRLAQNGNGAAAYIDRLEEAQKVLVREATSTLFPIAKDVKIQVEFNPAQVSEYRLIGYESRMLSTTDFKDDRVDAGEIGSGAAVTAIYEVTPSGSPARLSDDLRYRAARPAPGAPISAELGFLKIRHKAPDGDASRLIELPIGRSLETDLGRESDDVRFAAAVAAFGQKLKGAPQLAAMDWDEIMRLAEGARGADPFGYRADFLTLVELARALAPR